MYAYGMLIICYILVSIINDIYRIPFILCKRVNNLNFAKRIQKQTRPLTTRKSCIVKHRLVIQTRIALLTFLGFLKYRGTGWLPFLSIKEANALCSKREDTKKQGFFPPELCSNSGLFSRYRGAKSLSLPSTILLSLLRYD